FDPHPIFSRRIETPQLIIVSAVWKIGSAEKPQLSAHGFPGTVCETPARRICHILNHYTSVHCRSVYIVASLHPSPCVRSNVVSPQIIEYTACLSPIISTEKPEITIVISPRCRGFS